MKAEYLAMSLIIALTVVLSGCVNTAQTSAGNSEASAPENFRLLISDLPADIGDFDSVLVTFSSLRAFTNDSYVEKEISSEPVDLTKLTGDLSYPLVETDLDEGEYTKLELYVDTISATQGNDSVEIKVPSGKLMITKPFTVSANDTSSFVFDINVVKKGSGNYNLLPVISESGVVGKDIAEDKVKECSSRGQNCRSYKEKNQEREAKWKTVREKKKDNSKFNSVTGRQEKKSDSSKGSVAESQKSQNQQGSK